MSKFLRFRGPGVDGRRSAAVAGECGRAARRDKIAIDESARSAIGAGAPTAIATTARGVITAPRYGLLRWWPVLRLSATAMATTVRASAFGIGPFGFRAF